MRRSTGGRGAWVGLRTGAATGGRVGAGRSGEVSSAWRRELLGLSGPSGQGQQNYSVVDTGSFRFSPNFLDISNIADITKYVGAVLNEAIFHNL